MDNRIFITTISKGLNLSGFINTSYQKDVNDKLQKGELTDSLRYDNNFKYTKTGKEIKEALGKAKSSYQLKKDDLANQMSLLKEKLVVKPFAPISTWQMRGFDKQLGLQLNYPYEFFNYVDRGDGYLQKYPPSNSLDDCCTKLNKQYVCALQSESFPTTTEDAEPYYAYNRLLEDYIQQAVDILQLNIMIKNMNEKKSYELSQSQMMALDQYIGEGTDTLEKGTEDELEKGGVGSGRKIGTTQSGKTIYSHKKASEYKKWSQQDHEDAADEHYKIYDQSYDSSTKKYSKEGEHHFNMKEDHTEEYQKMEEKPKKNNLQKAIDVLGFDEDLNDIEKGDNEGGDGKAIMHTNGGDPVDVSDYLIVSGDDRYLDTIDPATGEARFKNGDKVKYKLEDDGSSHKGTVTDIKHPTYEQALKLTSKKKKAVEVA